MHRTILFVLSVAVLTSPAAAQVELSTAGNVAVGSQAPLANYRLRVIAGPNNNLAIYAYANHSTFRSGAHALATGSGGNTSYGVRGDADGASAQNYGLYGLADGGNNAYGVVASATGGTVRTYAAYFDGDLYITGEKHPPGGSDERMKENIVSLAGRGILAKVLALRPTSFRFKQTGEYAVMQLPEGERYGLIAQEVEQVFPELVVEGFHPGPVDEAGEFVGEPLVFKNVDYWSLLPLLVQALQEQQAELTTIEEALRAHGIPVRR